VAASCRHVSGGQCSLREAPARRQIGALAFSTAGDGTGDRYRRDLSFHRGLGEGRLTAPNRMVQKSRFFTDFREPAGSTGYSLQKMSSKFSGRSVQRRFDRLSKADPRVGQPGSGYPAPR
jgi:hypothetical protein